MARLDRVLRGIVLVPVFAVLATLAHVLVAWLLLYTSYGQEELRRFAEQKLNGALGEGSATIGKASFDLSGEVVLRDISVILDGQPAVSIAELRIDAEPFSFLGGEIRVPSIHAVEPVVDARLDLSRLAPPPEPESDEGGGMTVALGTIGIERGTLYLPDATIADAELAATVDLAERSIAVDEASARWVERDRTATLSGWARDHDGVLLVGDVVARVDGAVATVEVGSYDSATGAAAAIGSARVSADDLRALAGEWLPPQAERWRGDVDVELTAMRADAGAPWEVSTAGTIGAAELAGRATVSADGGDLAGRARVAGVRPDQLYDGAPEGDVRARLTLAGGEVTASGAGTLAGIEVERLEARAGGDLSDGYVVADLTDRRGVIHAEARGGRRADGTLVIRESHLHGDVSALVAHLNAPPMRQLQVDLHAVGATTDLEISGDADVVGLRKDTTRVGSAHVTLAVPHISVEDPERPLAGTIDVTASRVEVAGRRVGRARATGSFSESGRHLDVGIVVRELEFADVARGRVVIDTGPHRTDVRLRTARVDTGDLAWSGEGGRIAIYESGRLTVDDVDLTSDAGSVHVHGVLEAPRSRSKEGRLTVELRALDLAAAAPALAVLAKVDHPLAGAVDASIELGRRGRVFDVSGRADYRDLVWRPGAAAANGFVSGSLGHGKVSATVEAKARDHHGKIRLEVEANAPKNTMDERSWRRLDLADIGRAKLTLEAIDAHVVEAFAGDVVDATGTLAGTVEFPHEGDRALGIDLTVSGVDTPWVEQLGGSIEARWDDRELSGTAEVAQGGRRVIGGPIAIDRGFQQLWRRPLREFASARVSATGSVRDFDLRRLARTGLVREKVAGTFDGDVVLTGTVERPKVELRDARATDVALAGVQLSSVKLGGEWQGTMATGSVRVQQSAGGSIKVEGGVDWTAEPRVNGTVTASGFDLKPLRVFSTDDTSELAQLDGKLDANLKVSGAADHPSVRGRVKARRVKMLLENGTRRVEDGQLVVRFDGDRAIVEELTAKSGDGRVSATGSVDLGPWAFALNVKAVELPVVVGSYVTSVDAKGTYTGSWVDGRLDTRAEISEGTVRLADTGRELQDLGALEDVVFVERIGGARRDDVGPVVADAVPVQVRIVTLAPVRVKSPEVDALVNADLTMRFQGVLTYMKGQVEVERGVFTLFERSYQIAVGSATFDGPVPIDPALDIELRRTFPSAIVSIFVTDHLSDPRIQFRSDNPDYNDEQILAIILGQDPEEADRDRTPGQQAGGAAANIIVGKVVKDTLGLPIDIVRSHPDGYEIGKYFFGGTVLVGYRSRNTEELNENRNEGTIEWRLRRNILVEGAYGDANVGSLDILYIIRF